ncbi:heavy metal translocating P-type ATPase [Vagococcus acidifermentans]|uniref:Heavy metal translocating P-type ATPase n=1 Tax=Vagococcus acidifermentans TaxID=564710 RepID=A0A430B173_9ENTE|nr:heavy metal translocating P-type ATPase [Vagococcus acidifermentans]RSU13972.1 heavy metal translocating P-type ATPase [Vagococcus acidifermentans]
MTFIKQQKVMLAAITCGVMMVGGLILEKSGFAYYPAIYIIGMIIGGYQQTKEGIIDTIENKHLNVDLLMALAAIGACTIQYYFEGIMLTFIFSTSGALEEYTTSKSKKEIESLMEIQPETAQLMLDNGQTKEVPVESLKIGDKLLVPKGANVPIDGTLLDQYATLNEAAITGESLPVEKTTADNLFASTNNLGNSFTMTVTKEAKDTLFSKIIRLVNEAQNTPSKTASFLKDFENKYVKVVLVAVPLMIFIPYFFLNWTWNESFYRGMVLLVVASPCALVASATPATLAAISNGARNQVLFKGGIFLEALADLKAVNFDKTGTLTEGKPVVTDDVFVPGFDDAHTQNIVTAIEGTSTHPLAQALVAKYNSHGMKRPEQLIVEEISGFGMQGTEGETIWKIGKESFVTNKPLSEKIAEDTRRFQAEGKTVVYISKNDDIAAYFALLDMPKQEAVDTIRYFKQEGIQTVMLTGDHEKTALAIAKILDVDEVHASHLPEDKAAFILEQKKTLGTNAMVGDGINDAPALANASIGVAMGQGTDVAIDVSDVVLIKNDLHKLQMSHQLSLKLKRIITQNIVFSLSVIVLLILSNFFKIINLPLGVIGHEGSTILVILNGLRMLKNIPLKHESAQPTDSEIEKARHSSTYA